MSILLQCRLLSIKKRSILESDMTMAPNIPIHSASRHHVRPTSLASGVSKSLTRLPPASTPSTAYHYHVWQELPAAPASPSSPFPSILSPFPSVPSSSPVAPAAQAARSNTVAGEAASLSIHRSHPHVTHQPPPRRTILPQSTPTRANVSAADRHPPKPLVEVTREGCDSHPDEDG